MSYALSSFSPQFMLLYGESVPEPSKKPTSVLQAIVSLAQHEWNRLARELFQIDPAYLTIDDVIAKIEKTNTCRNLDSPVEVYIDPEGDFSLLVFDTTEAR